MYGLFSFANQDRDASAAKTTFTLFFWNPFAPDQQPSAATALQHKQRATAFVAAQVPKEDKALRDALVMCLWSITPCMPPGMLDFMMFLALAHHRLPAVERQARESRIQQLVEAQGAFASTDLAEFKRQKALLQNIAILFPDALLPANLRSICGPMRFNSCVLPSCPDDLLPLQQMVDRLCLNLHERHARSAEVIEALKGVLFHSQPDELVARWDTVARAVNLDWSLLLLPALDRIGRWPPTGMSSIPAEALLCAMTAGGGVAADSLLQPTIERAIDDALARFNQSVTDVQLATLEAALAGVPLGAASLPTAHAANRLIDEAIDQVSRRMTSERIEQCGQVRDLQGDLAPVHAWAVNRLLRWIEGPIVNPAPLRRVDRARAVTAENQRTRPAGAAAKGASPLPMTPRDVDTLVENGFAATADFFIADITDMVALATALGGDKALVQACDRLREPLAQLAAQPASIDELKAGPLLAQAESCITALRGNIKARQTQDQLQEKFAARLEAALACETMVLGRRQGGVIACPMQASDWPGVVMTFHHRLLSRARRIEIDGETVLLRPDQALALYVTGSSQSNHAFDVSVHLWQRRPEATAGPGRTVTAWPAMNSPAWFDTYITCCVLHVPHAS